MRARSMLIGPLLLLACSTSGDDKANADVLGDLETGESAATGDGASEDESETGPLADCVPPLPAVGVGNCTDVLGYQWGPECDPIYGCSCEGEGCATLFADVVDCRHTYSHCDPCEACSAEQACAITCGHIAGDVYDILCADKCEGCSICPDGFNSAGGCPLDEPPSELPYYECHIED